MTLRQLELFIAVAETKSFSRGAELIALTQSTVSQHIAALEQEVNTKLLDRTSKGIFLTAGGQVFLQHARRVLAERDILNQAMAGFHGLEKAKLELGASNIPANYLVPAVLPRLNERYPGISLNMQIGDTQEILDDLRSGEVELGIVGGRVEDDIFTYTPLIKDLLVLIVGAGHPLQEKQKITLEELMSLPIIVRENGSGTYQALQKTLYSKDLDPAELKIIARSAATRRSARRLPPASVALLFRTCRFVPHCSVAIYSNWTSPG